MKKPSILILLILLAGIPAKSQVFTVTELEILSSKNISDIEDSLFKKGFEFDNYDTTIKATVYTYVPFSVLNPGEKKGGIFRIQSSKGKILLTYITNKEEYTKLKEDVNNKGYKFIGSDNKKNLVEYLYKNSQFGVSFSIQVLPYEALGVKNVYIFQIMKYP